MIRGDDRVEVAQRSAPDGVQLEGRIASAHMSDRLRPSVHCRLLVDEPVPRPPAPTAPGRQEPPPEGDEQDADQRQREGAHEDEQAERVVSRQVPKRACGWVETRIYLFIYFQNQQRTHRHLQVR